MISRKAVREFRERKLTSYAHAHKWSRKYCRTAVQELPVRPPVWKRLSKVQRICLLIGIEQPKFLYLLDTGMGKTLLAIALGRYLRKIGKVHRIIVLVPNKSNTAEWKREFKKHCPKTRCLVLSGTSKNKLNTLRTKKALFYVVTYAGFARMLTIREKHPKKDKDRLRPDRKLVLELSELVDGLILDESNFVKNIHSLVFRLCRKLSETVNMLVCLTGSPFGTDPTDLWSQFYLLDKGETLGGSLGLFRALFFKESRCYWGGFEYAFDSKKDEELAKRLQNRSIVFEAEEADLPKSVYQKLEVRHPMDSKQYYDKVKEELIAASGNFQEIENAYLRMRQIASGFVGYYDDEEGKRAEIEFSENPKLERFLQLVESIPRKRKIVTFHEFIFSGSMIGRELKKRDIGFVRLDGRTKDPDMVLEQFHSDPDTQMILVNSKAGAYGLNLQTANYLVYYEAPDSVILRRQTWRRVNRQYNLAKTVFSYDIIIKGSVEQKILDSHARGESLRKRLLRNPNLV